MKKRIVAAALLLLPGGMAAAQDALPVETILVEDGSPAGVWKFRLPSSVRGSMFGLGSTQWGPMVDVFCRIDKITGDLSVHCPGLSLGKAFISRGTVTIKDDRIRMLWGAGSRFGLEGTLHSAGQFEGTFFVENFLTSSHAPEKATGSKLTLLADAPDTGGKSALLARLLDEAARGAPLSRTLDPKVRTQIPTPDALRPLGAMQAILYLGEKTLPGEAPMSAYDVEFTSGNLICDLRQRNDIIDAFNCG